MSDIRLPDTLALPLAPDLTDFALVDEADFWVVADSTWYRTPAGYVLRNPRDEDGETERFLHREIMRPGPGLVVDHINGDPLDNRRANLRVCTQAQNRANSMKPRRDDTTSRYKGVRVVESGWTVVINRHYVGTYHTEAEAARAYDDAARRLYGEFARLNFPRRGERSALRQEKAA